MIRPKKKHSIFLIRNSIILLLGLAVTVKGMAQYRLNIQFSENERSVNIQSLKLQTSFTNSFSCSTYINGLKALLGSKGYPTASVDSIDEQGTFTAIKLFLGKQYHWIKLNPGGVEKKALDESGYTENKFTGKLLNMVQLQTLQEKILVYYEKNGFPFAAVYLDSILLQDDKMDALLKVDKGPLYHLDSIRVFGKGRISKKFLYHYLGLPKGGIYNQEKLAQVSKKLRDLPYIQEQQPADVTMLGTGSLLNLYLAPKRSSHFDFLIGVLPNSNQNGKLQVTADVNLDLKNILGNGESILLKWQQLQVQSPRLNIGYQQPYIFNSSFGIDFLFDLFKKDSSFLQVNALLGLQYLLSASQSGKVFFQWQKSFLLNGAIDTNQIKATKKLPPNIDVTLISGGLDYELNKTDYRLNPRSGNELKFTLSAGIKNIKQNAEITGIKDPAFNYASLYDSIKAGTYLFRIKLAGVHYFPLGKQATFKTALNAGLYGSKHVFRNELFQIGGYKLLRGFNEESIYATQYSVLTAEYRYRLALNSYFYGFVDGAWVKNKFRSVDLKNTFISGGLGIVYETKFGILNISYAAGKRDDVKFNIGETSKIHFGYVNYF